MNKVLVQILLGLLVVILVVAGALTAKFLTKKCVEGTYSCVDTAVAKCVENDWKKTACEYGCLENPVRCKEAQTEQYIVKPVEPVVENITQENETIENTTNTTTEQPETSLETGEITYTQSLKFYRNGLLSYAQDPTLAPFASVYFLIKSNFGTLYTYRLALSPGIPYITGQDLVGWKFEIMNKQFTITDATLRKDNKVEGLIFESGETLLELRDGRVKVNSATLLGLTYTIASDKKKLTEIRIDFTPRFNEILSLGQSYDDKFLGQFRLTFKNLISTQTEKVLFKTNGKAGNVYFKNYDGMEVNLPLFSDGRQVVLGTGSSVNERIYLEGESCNIAPASDKENCQRAMFLVVEDSKAKVMQISNIHVGTGRIIMHPVTYSRGFAGGGDVAYDFTFGKPSQIKVDGLTNPIVLNIDRKKVQFIKLGSSDGARINLLGNAYLDIVNKQNISIYKGLVFGEYPGEGDKLPIDKLSDVKVDAKVEMSNLVYVLNDINYGGEGFGFVPASESVTNILQNSLQNFMTNKGTLYQYDKLQKDIVTIEYPSKATYGTIILKTHTDEYSFGKNDFYLGKYLGSYPALTKDDLPGLLESGIASK